MKESQMRTLNWYRFTFSKRIYWALGGGGGGRKAGGGGRRGRPPGAIGKGRGKGERCCGASLPKVGTEGKGLEEDGRKGCDGGFDDGAGEEGGGAALGCCCIEAGCGDLEGKEGIAPVLTEIPLEGLETLGEVGLGRRST